MATSMIRFEVQLPEVDPSTQDGIAIGHFLDSLGGLAPFAIVTQNIYTSWQNGTAAPTEVMIVYGIIATSQAASALGFLNTLNTALGFNVSCFQWSVTTEP